ncbi:MAG: tRNA (adenosine(37)-N6)-threonylcarbamoyltransferase complex transferase subunit TsaD, partial [Verrucomicrobia bacterium]|nr:tRNA (adenosine(37)-N6)-threonylcarbamoyltransferase complex transferase subunit TsaD [Verrucomicrobiota bacterium]
MSEPTVLAIETSCDETAVAVLQGRSRLLCSEVASQIDVHRSYGGVVPEIASRNHLAKMGPILRSALTHIQLREVDCVSATRGPGLLTSLLVGYAAGKGLAIGLDRPFVGINHLEGHLLSPFFGEAAGPVQSMGLIVSGGHTMLMHLVDLGKYILVGQTRDDAAGEAFDKVARL